MKRKWRREKMGESVSRIGGEGKEDGGKWRREKCAGKS